MIRGGRLISGSWRLGLRWLAGYLWLALTFLWSGAQRDEFNFCFSSFLDKNFILAGGLGTGLSLYEVISLSPTRGATRICHVYK